MIEDSKLDFVGPFCPVIFQNIFFMVKRELVYLKLFVVFVFCATPVSSSLKPAYNFLFLFLKNFLFRIEV